MSKGPRWPSNPERKCKYVGNRGDSVESPNRQLRPFFGNEKKQENERWKEGKKKEMTASGIKTYQRINNARCKTPTNQPELRPRVSHHNL